MKKSSKDLLGKSGVKIAPISNVLKTHINTISTNIQDVNVIRHPNITPIQKIPTNSILFDQAPYNSIEEKIDIELNKKTIWPEHAPLSEIYGGNLILEEDHPWNLVEILKRAAKKPKNIGIKFIDSFNKISFLSYNELYEKATRLATELCEQGIKEEQVVILQYTENENFLIAFWASILIGAIPTPIGILKSIKLNSSGVVRLKNVCELLDFPVILCDTSQENKLKELTPIWEELFEINFKQTKVISTDNVQSKTPFLESKEIISDQVTLHLLTSGTTGKPKCVQHSHKTLCHHVAINSQGYQLKQDSVYLNWMPLDHVGGIVMAHLGALFKQCRQVQVDVNLFAVQPLRWLSWISENKITHTWSPNFSFQVITSQLKDSQTENWDLSSLKSILNGGEQVTNLVCQEFLEIMAAYGMKNTVINPGWGMSETSSVMTINDCIIGGNPESGVQKINGFTAKGVAIHETEGTKNLQVFIEIGKVLPGVTMRVVSADQSVVPQGVKGKLQVKSPTLMLGYLNNSKANKDVFTEDGWLDTGDLAFMVNDRITIAGREKDMIIINGINYACHDIEESNESIFGVEENWSVACSIPNPENGSDSLAIFFVSSGTEENFIHNVIKQIKQEVAKQFGIVPSLILPIQKTDLPKTNIGKKQRIALVKKYQEGHLIETEKKFNLNVFDTGIVPDWFIESCWSASELEVNSEIDKKILVSNNITNSVLNKEYEIIEFDNPQLASLLNKQHIVDALIIDFTSVETEKDILFLKLCGILSKVSTVVNHLLVVTKQSLIVKESDTLNTVSGISGLVKTISHEMEHIKFSSMLDLENPLTESLNWIEKEVGTNKENLVAAIRNKKRYITTLKKQPVLEQKGLIEKPLPLKQDGIYIITGGLGGIGCRLAEYLLNQFSAHVILIGRTDYDNLQTEQILQFNRLKRLKGNLAYCSIDLTNYSEIEDYISKLELENQQRIEGIFHFAGIIQEVLLSNLTPISLNEMYLAKVYGTINLSKLLDQRKECLFVTTSSARTIKSGMTIGSYAAASEFTEHFTRKLFLNNLNAYCLSWSLWEGVGMGKNLAIKHVLANRGYLAMPPEQALSSLLVALKLKQAVTYIGLDHNATEIKALLITPVEEQEIDTVLISVDQNDLDVSELHLNIKKFEAENIPIHVLKLQQQPYLEDGMLDLTRIEALLYAKQYQFEAPETKTELILADIWKTVLNQQSISKTDNFFALGGDSLKATGLLSRIKDEFKVTIGIEHLFEQGELYSLSKLIDSHAKNTDDLKDVVLLKRETFPYKFPMTLGQQRQWFSYIYAPKNPMYVNAFSLMFSGSINLTSLRKSLNALVERHESLRTQFNSDKEAVLFQIINAPYLVELPLIDITGLNEKEQEDRLFQLRLEESNTVFDLEHDQMLRCKFIKISEHKSELLFSIHHIVSDGWSAGVFVKDLKEFYVSFELGIENKLPKLKFNIADFGEWQKQNLEKNAYQNTLTYWKSKLNGAKESLDFPYDYTRSSNQNFLGKAHIISLPKVITKQLKELSEKEESTLYMTMLSAFGILLKRYSKQEDVIIGSLVANRQNSELENHIGFLVNTLALRFDVRDSLSFKELLNHVKSTVLEAWKHQDLPFDKLIDELNIERGNAMHPLFQVLFVQQNAHSQNINLNGVPAEFAIHDQDATRFDIECHVFDKEETIDVKIIYNTDLLNQTTIEQFSEQYISLLSSVVAKPETRIVQHQILSKKQEHLILNQWNNTTQEMDSRSVQNYWYEQASKHKNAIALTGKKQEYTYGWLNEFTENLAGLLQSKGVKPGVSVGLLFGREDELYIAILAVVKAGGIYVPLDPNYPEDRLLWMNKDTNAPILLCSNTLIDAAKKYNTSIVVVDVAAPVGTYSLNRKKTFTNTEQAIYIYYTSGSTGTPKGVVVPQRGVIRTVIDCGYYPISATDSFLQLANPSFDVLTFEIWGAWLNGGRLIVVDKDDILDVNRLADIIIEQGVTCNFMTVPLFNNLIETRPESIKGYKCLLVGGDAISVSHSQKALEFLPKGLMNGYGPTENTTFTTTYPITKIVDRQTSVPIGYPLKNSQIYILDANRMLLPSGVPGEIYAAGDGVAIGYLNNEETTKKKFISDPFAKKGLMYNTGDLGRWLPDGSVEYLGRADNQVKIRGHRVECGEIESTINLHTAIKQAVVLPITDDSGNKKLAAWVVLEHNTDIDDWQLYLSEHLPNYMIPSYLTVIDKIPLNTNGKVDKKSLPKPAVAKSSDGVIKPTNEKELVLVEVWSEILGIDNLGIRNKFFEMGGDSIILVQMISKLMAKGYHLKPKNVFQLHTIENLAKVMTKVTSVIKIDQNKITGNVPLSPIQNWFFDFNKDHTNFWNLPALISLNELPDPEILKLAINKLTEHHDMLRASYNKEKDGKWTQTVLNSIPEILIEYLNFKNESKADVLMRSHAQLVQRSLNLTQGKLIKTAVYKLPNGDVKLFLCLHHLIIDGISWRILVEDLKQLLAQPSRKLPAKTASFKAWQNTLKNYASNQLIDQKDYWKNCISALNSESLLPEIDLSKEDVERLALYNEEHLTKEWTNKFVLFTNSAYKTQFNDILIVALSRSIHELTKRNRFCIMMEGHGREYISDNIDISRTIGWFTTAYPVHITNDGKTDLAKQIKTVKKTFRQIPENGLGYGVLKYISNEVASEKTPEICFNYLGRLDQSSQDFQLASTKTGYFHHRESLRAYPIEINCWINNGEFTVNVSTPGYTNRYNDLSKIFIKNLKQVIDHCSQVDRSNYEVSDFKHVKLTEKELEFLPDGIEDIYPLTNNQKGMLYQYLNYPEAKVYFTQVRQELLGKIVTDQLVKAINIVVDKYDILRTQFIWNGVSEPLQMCMNKVEVLLKYTDISSFNKSVGNELNTILETDLNTLIDLSHGATPRFQLIKTGNESYKLVMSFHHIILDGWSLFLVLNEIIDTYHLLASETFSGITPVKLSFKDYVIGSKKEVINKKFWKKYLQGVEALPKVDETIKSRGLHEKANQITQEFDEHYTERLKALAVSNNITLNTLVQTAWVLVLDKFKKDHNVVFGTTFSGRLAEVENMQSIAGLLINTLPLRVNCHNRYESILALSHRIQNLLLDLQEHQTIELNDSFLAAELDVSKQYFDSILVFENYVNKANTEHHLVTMGTVTAYEHTNFPLSVIVVPDEKLLIRISHHQAIYNNTQVEGLQNALKQIFDIMLSNIHQTIGGINFTSNATSIVSLKEWMHSATVNTLYEDQDSVYRSINKSDKNKDVGIYLLNDTYQLISSLDEHGEVYLMVDDPIDQCGEWGEWMMEHKIDNPFIEKSFLYPTGDIGKWNEKGSIDLIESEDI